MLVRLKLDGEKVVKEERMLQGVLGRIRDVRAGPDGFIYLLTDESPGVPARLRALDSNDTSVSRAKISSGVKRRFDSPCSW